MMARKHRSAQVRLVALSLRLAFSTWVVTVSRLQAATYFMIACGQGRALLLVLFVPLGR